MPHKKLCLQQKPIIKMIIQVGPILKVKNRGTAESDFLVLHSGRWSWGLRLSGSSQFTKGLMHCLKPNGNLFILHVKIPGYLDKEPCSLVSETQASGPLLLRFMKPRFPTLLHLLKWLLSPQPSQLYPSQREWEKQGEGHLLFRVLLGAVFSCTILIKAR